MKFQTSVSLIFKCSLERAFKTPMLCDVTKVHTGFGLMPKVTHVMKDENWAKSGSSKEVYVAKSISQKGGFASKDNILERVENKYWTIKVDDFQSWMLGFYMFVGEWKTTELEEGKILVEYTYFLHSNNPFFYPINWAFTKIFWKIYMKRVMVNVRNLAYRKEPYQYE